MLTRKPGEEIILMVKGGPVDGAEIQPDDLIIKIIIQEVRGKQVNLGIGAPRDKVKIIRGELVEQPLVGNINT